MKAFWEQRYSEEGFAYGTAPNEYFRAVLETLAPGRMLLPAEGEGRNAAYAAGKGWEVKAFDFSAAARAKALGLAAEAGVSIDYELIQTQDFHCAQPEFDAVGLIYAHFPPEVRTPFHRKLIDCLRPGGLIILEAFEKSQLGRESGGPKKRELLYSEAELKQDFAGLRIRELRTETLVLSEGRYHAGEAVVVRLLAEKLQPTQ